jgi:hypothetical protein
MVSNTAYQVPLCLFTCTATVSHTYTDRLHTRRGYTYQRLVAAGLACKQPRGLARGRSQNVTTNSVRPKTMHYQVWVATCKRPTRPSVHPALSTPHCGSTKKRAGERGRENKASELRTSDRLCRRNAVHHARRCAASYPHFSLHSSPSRMYPTSSSSQQQGEQRGGHAGPPAAPLSMSLWAAAACSPSVYTRARAPCVPRCSSTARASRHSAARALPAAAAQAASRALSARGASAPTPRP